MKRIVFATVGSLGDVHPYVAIGKALLARGHRPVITTTDRYQALIEAEGIEYAPLRPAESQFGGLEAVAARLFDPWHGPSYLIREMVMPFVREQYEDITSASKDADLLVTHPLTVTGPLVCAKLGVPWISSVLAPASLMSAIDPPLIHPALWAELVRRLGVMPHRALLNVADRIARRWERPLAALRSELGLPPAGQAALFRGQFSPRLNLALFPKIIIEQQEDWPSNTLVTGMPHFDGRPADPLLLQQLDRFLGSGDPPIVFALGSSAVMLAGDFWDKAIEASLKLRRRAILLTGAPLSRALPQSMKAFDYLPYSTVFSQAAAVVHQAGIGTLTQALAAGRPQLIVPFAFDQPDNARRAVGLGVGRPLPIRKVTTTSLVRELSALLADGNYASIAKKVAHQINDGSDCAADAILAALS